MLVNRTGKIHGYGWIRERENHGRRKRGFCASLLGGFFQRLQNHHIPGIPRRLGDGLGFFLSIFFYFTDAFCSGRGGIAPIHLPSGVLSAWTLFFCFFYYTWGNLWHCLVFFDISFAVSCPLASCVDKHIVAWMLGCFVKDHVTLSVDVDQE